MELRRRFSKRTAEKLDYQVNMTDWLAGDTVTEAKWTYPAGLTKPADPSLSQDIATVWVGSGTPGKVYELAGQIKTASGRVKQVILEFEIVP